MADNCLYFCCCSSANPLFASKQHHQEKPSSEQAEEGYCTGIGGLRLLVLVNAKVFQLKSWPNTFATSLVTDVLGSWGGGDDGEEVRPDGKDTQAAGARGPVLLGPVH